MEWLNQEVILPNEIFFQRAVLRQQRLTKPPGSLGRIEECAIRLAAMQENDTPVIDQVWIAVFAADHGIAQESVSAFPQVVTTEMVKNFAHGGAAINVLAAQVNAALEIIDVGILESLSIKTVIEARAGPGTRNFIYQPAMDREQLKIALNAGKSSVVRAVEHNAQLFIGGDMGIANTSSASAIASKLLDIDPVLVTGAGTGLDNQEIGRKVELIRLALANHLDSSKLPLVVLQNLGGFEIAALVGAFLHAAQRQIPVLVDGFITSVAALLAVKINPPALNWFFFAHCSQEKGHQLVLKALHAKPLLNLNMRLGEASGAALAVPLLRSACALHNQMATFEQAQISTE